MNFVEVTVKAAIKTQFDRKEPFVLSCGSPIHRCVELDPVSHLSPRKKNN
jgi:hypothetical protein